MYCYVVLALWLSLVLVVATVRAGIIVMKSTTNGQRVKVYSYSCWYIHVGFGGDISKIFFY